MEDIIGRRIKAVRPMTTEELAAEGWTETRRHGVPSVLVLDNGAKIYPARDSEGNGPGALFGVDKHGDQFLISN